MSNDRGGKRTSSGVRRWSELIVGPWPCEDPGCLACELTPQQWEEILVRVFEHGEDIYLIDDTGGWYPLELRHVTDGPNGMNKMLRLVKGDARAAARDGRAHHSHTAHMKPR